MSVTREEINRARVRTKTLRAIRAAKLREPLCRDCRAEGLTVAATEVDHIRPLHRARDFDHLLALAADPENLAHLCHQHHLEKTVRDLRGSNPPRIRAIRADGSLAPVQEPGRRDRPEQGGDR